MIFCRKCGCSRFRKAGPLVFESAGLQPLDQGEKVLVGHGGRVHRDVVLDGRVGGRGHRGRRGGGLHGVVHAVHGQE